MKTFTVKYLPKVGDVIVYTNQDPHNSVVKLGMRARVTGPYQRRSDGSWVCEYRGRPVMEVDFLDKSGIPDWAKQPHAMYIDHFAPYRAILKRDKPIQSRAGYKVENVEFIDDPERPIRATIHLPTGGKCILHYQEDGLFYKSFEQPIDLIHPVG